MEGGMMMLNVVTTLNGGCSLAVDKNRPRVTPRCQPQPQQQPPVPPDLMPTECSARGTESYQAQCERMNQSLQQLQGLLAASNCKFQAIVVVLQQTLVKEQVPWGNYTFPQCTTDELILSATPLSLAHYTVHPTPTQTNRDPPSFWLP
ncbi:hypothetical protein J4Q44_G00301800 [Coregonus suidteri]|uniref:Uncharacterized protein n=1 Tax=Coregonus suidteri TaxID=861788 RepID=A0AAN8QBF3_9TELE